MKNLLFGYRILGGRERNPIFIAGFDYVRQGEWVVFFDEFDVITKDRNTLNEHGETQRLANSLLQLIDNFSSQNK